MTPQSKGPASGKTAKGAKRVWMPYDMEEGPWIAWAGKTKKEVIQELDESYYGSWRAEGVCVALFSIIRSPESPKGSAKAAGRSRPSPKFHPRRARK